MVVLLLTAFALALCLPTSAAEIRSADGNSRLRAAEIVNLGDKMILKGSAHVRLADKLTGTVFEADAATITIIQFPPAKKGEPAKAAADKKADAVGGLNLSDIKSVEFVGPVKMTYIKPKEVIDASGRKATVMTQMDANSDAANYDGTKQMAYLTGNVTMTLMDPTMYESPAIASGDLIEVNMKPKPGPDDLIFRISTPGGVSHLEATPLPKEETKAK